jgi:hypothetical protein
MLQKKVVVSGAMIMRGLRLWSSIAVQFDEFRVVNILGDQRPRVASRSGLCFGRAEREAASKGSGREREKSELARHEGSIRIKGIGPYRRWGTNNRLEYLHNK